MSFVLAEESPSVVASLRALEPQAPKPLKAAMLQGADYIDALERAAFESAAALELAATLKAGFMDSDAKHAEVQREIRLTLTQVAAKLRAVLE